MGWKTDQNFNNSLEQIYKLRKWTKSAFFLFFAWLIKYFKSEETQRLCSAQVQKKDQNNTKLKEGRKAAAGKPKAKDLRTLTRLYSPFRPLVQSSYCVSTSTFIQTRSNVHLWLFNPSTVPLYNHV